MDCFRFVSLPFTRELKVDHRFKVDFIEAELKMLQETVEARQSAVLIGPAGSGKSVVLRGLVDSLSESRYRVIYLKLANLGARDMCKQVAIGLGLASTGNFPVLIRSLEERLQSGYNEQGMRQVLIFDDAHEMKTESLRLVRLLTNYDMDSKLVVSIILAGHTSLKKILLSSELEDVRQRLNLYSELRLLSREETKEYVNHRIKLSGTSKSPFAADAYEALFEITQGNMRAIDKMAIASLRESSSAGRSTVSASDVAAARAGQWM
jgi:type II secretory pathway predicted ATPase ExeA